MLKLLLPFLFLASLPVFGQDEAPKPPKLFEDDSLMEVTLSGPWRKIMQNKDSEETFPGSLTYKTVSGDTRTIGVGLKTRGLTRRDVICDFPPLKIYFDKDENKGTEFRGQKSLKLVSYCQADKRFVQYNVKEYLAYRVYNLVTPYSFRVRPLNVTYQETGSNRGIERFSFLIEDIDDVAKRNELKEVGIASLDPGELDQTEIARFTLFQYLIANLDWAATAAPGGEDCCHNGKLIGESDDARPVIAIPYDFDSSGLVDAHYAAPPAQLGMRKITQRLYRGFCANNDRVPATVQQFRELQPAIIDLIENQSFLDGRSRSNAIRFVQSFYSGLKSSADIQEKLIDKCRG